MKTYIAVYGPDNRNNPERSIVGERICKLVSAPESSTQKMVEEALVNTNAGPYTYLIRVIDLQELPHIILAEKTALTVLDDS